MSHIIKILALFFATCVIAGCKKICSTGYESVLSYLHVSTERECNLGDTIYVQIQLPFNSINQRNGQMISVEKTKNISEFIISLIRVDTMPIPGQFMPALNLFKIDMLTGKSIRRSDKELFKDVRLLTQFEKKDSAFEVTLRLISLNKGVFLIEHANTVGQMGCTEVDILPALKNSRQNVDLYVPGATDSDYSHSNAFFFKVN